MSAAGNYDQGNLKRGGSSSDDESKKGKEEKEEDAAGDYESEDWDSLTREEMKARCKRLCRSLADRDKKLALLGGNYYSSIEQVWTNEDHHFNHRGYFDALRRDRAPIFKSPDGISYYKTTLEKALDSSSSVVPDPAPAEAAAASTSSPAVSSARKYFETHRATWPVDVFGNPYVKGLPLAHLVPHGPNNATLYFDVVACVLGLQDGAAAVGGQVGPVPPEWDTVQKAIHGATDYSMVPPKKLDHTGIKHSVPNMIRLDGQARYFDTDPGLIIVPILTLDEVKAWKGEPYDALAMAGEVREKVEGQGYDVTSDFPTVCKRIAMTTEGGREASDDEIEKGRKLLRSVVLGMAYSLKYRTPDRDRHLTQVQLTKLEGYRARFPANAKQVLVPAPNPNAPEPLRVRVVEFGSATAVADGDDDATTAAAAAEVASKAKDKSEKKKLHPAPDPLLLAARAAINWSRRRNQQLLAAAEPQPDVYETEYDRRVEQYFESLDRANRPPDDDPEEFARRLGQLPPDKQATAAAR